MDYEIFRRWALPNGGEGKAILIDPSLVDEAGMTSLCKTLQADTAQDRNAFVYIFTDREAAEMWRLLAGDGDREIRDEFYQQHFVGTYMRNANTGHHEFVWYLDGPTGSYHKVIDCLH